ncbi:phosphatidylglycerophosphatase A [bacterium]|nr:phosphatidylglycerophosphatase A [bacterium]NBX78683.1 phosphatidylglycerophosphatase A [bacterium]
MNKNILWLSATICGVGLLPGGGTVASFITLPFYFLDTVSLCLVLLISSLVCGAAISFGQRWYQKKDPSQIVIDEFVAALLLIFLLKTILLCSFEQVAMALILFRFFDMTKIFGLRDLEKVQGVWGVLLDDLGAALYSFLIFYFLV